MIIVESPLWASTFIILDSYCKNLKKIKMSQQDRICVICKDGVPTFSLAPEPGGGNCQNPPDCPCENLLGIAWYSDLDIFVIVVSVVVPLETVLKVISNNSKSI